MLELSMAYHVWILNEACSKHSWENHSPSYQGFRTVYSLTSDSSVFEKQLLLVMGRIRQKERRGTFYGVGGEEGVS